MGSTKKINLLYVKPRLKKGYFKVIVFYIEKYPVASVCKVQHLCILKIKTHFYAVIAAEHIRFLCKMCS